MATQRQRAAARRNIRSAQAANRGRGRPRTRAFRTQRAPGNPRNRAPGTRGMSTREYGMATTRTSRRATYAYPRGAGRDRGRRPSYPINNLRRARAALAYAARRNTAGNVATIKRALRAKGGAYAALANRSSAGRGRRRAA